MNQKKCNEEMRVMQRCVGYYSDRQSVNKGKLEEIKMRKYVNLNPFKNIEEERPNKETE